MRPTVLALLVVLALAGPAFAGGYFSDARLEADEVNGPALDALGQKTCIREAMVGMDAPGCPREVVPYDEWETPGEPVMGTLVLDSFYTTHVGLPPPADAARNLETLASDVQAAPTERPAVNWIPIHGNNAHRDSGGTAPDVILPGPGQIRAWHGWWDDKDEDGVIASWGESGAHARVNDEWHSGGSARIAAYVSPGSHPDWRSLERPGDSSPDFWFSRYVLSGYTYYQSGLQATSFVVFTDGSLVQRMTVRSVTDPILAPSADGTAPYTTTARSLVDIDVYAAAAPGPVETLYGSTAATFVNTLGSPSLGTCPNGCRPGVFSPREIGLEASEPFVAGLASEVYARYPREWADGEGSSSSGRHAEHVERYAPWIDLIPTWGYRSTNFLDPFYFLRGGPLPGKTDEGRQAMLPGFLSFEVRTGLWKDLDGDGFVGSGGADPYYGGTRPLPDDYVDPRGEYFGLFADALDGVESEVFRIVLTPDTAWSPGVLAHERVAVTGTDPETAVACVDRDAGKLCVNEPTSSGYFVGRETLSVWARRDVTGFSAGDDRTPGLYRSGSLFFPFGTDGFGFTACTEALTLAYAGPEGATTATLRDCDWIGPLASRT
ncbi:MAG TPA: hypothetical protein VM889_08535 [Candidatus Thermoplasmatota archaeon]|nr:hypothetical protein [Candidatus Thermoplasmatota archaeon]